MNTNVDRIINMADSSGPSRTQGFAYDNNDALTNYTTNATTQGYQYDEDGNRTVQSNGGATTNYAYASGSNRLMKLTGSQKATLQYDATGNIVADGVNRYTYDTLGRLVQVSNAAGSTRYQFDPLGQRVAKLNGSGKEGKDDSGDKRDGTRVGKGNGNEDSKSATTYFTYDTAGHLIGEYSRQRSQSTEYVWLDNAPVAVLKKNGNAPAQLYYVHTDHLGTPRQVTHSATNAVVWEWFGEPFGTSVPDEDPGHSGKKFTLNLRYAGQYFDKESSLFHNGFRDYNPKIGRYVQSDPIGLKGGINTYTYVGGNPVSFVDPRGLATTVVINNNDPVIGTHAGVVVGSGSDAVLYDPGGNYRNAEKGSGDALYGRDVNLNDYINYQRKDGSEVQIYTFLTTPAQEAAIKARIENNGSRGPGYCAADTSKALDGIGPFKGLGISITPSGLGRALSGR